MNYLDDRASQELHDPPCTGNIVAFHPSFQMSFIDHHKQRHATPCSSLGKQTIRNKEADDKEGNRKTCWICPKDAKNER